MPALDRYHNAVRNALVKDGWTITADPLRLVYGEHTLAIDLSAEKVLRAEKAEHKIAVEIKTFVGPSQIANLQQAVGQFGMYEDVLANVEPERVLYLAVPEPIYEEIFSEPIGTLMIQKRVTRLIIFSVADEEILRWIPQPI